MISCRIVSVAVGAFLLASLVPMSALAGECHWLVRKVAYLAQPATRPLSSVDPAENACANENIDVDNFNRHVAAKVRERSDAELVTHVMSEVAWTREGERVYRSYLSASHQGKEYVIGCSFMDAVETARLSFLGCFARNQDQTPVSKEVEEALLPKDKFKTARLDSSQLAIRNGVAIGPKNPEAEITYYYTTPTYPPYVSADEPAYVMAASAPAKKRAPAVVPAEPEVPIEEPMPEVKIYRASDGR